MIRITLNHLLSFKLSVLFKELCHPFLIPMDTFSLDDLIQYHGFKY